MRLGKAHYNAMCIVLKPFEANVLAGRTKTVDALDSMSKDYMDGWSKFGLDDFSLKQ
jgi:hypothetical protein